MSALDRWERRFGVEHPRAYVVAEFVVALVMFALVVLWLYAIVPEVPAT